MINKNVNFNLNNACVQFKYLKKNNLLHHWFCFVFLSRWPRNVFELGKQHGSRYHVLLLHDVGDGTSISKVSLVEEAFDHHPTGPYLIYILTIHPITKARNSFFFLFIKQKIGI